MKKKLLLSILFIAGCASFGAEYTGLEKQILLLREQYAEGVVVYKTIPGNKDLDSVIFNMSNQGQVDLTVKYHRFSFVYGLGVKYASGNVLSETKEAKLMYRIDDFTFLSPNEVKVAIPKKVAEKIVEQKVIVLTLLEKPKTDGAITDKP
jgi:hypothetical protein